MKVPMLSLNERKSTFKEVETGFSKEEALKEANRCLQCTNPLCVQGCPAKVNIPKFIKEFREGNIDLASKTIKESNYFPSVCGRICQHEKQCEGHCILMKKNDPICIGGIERFIGDNSNVQLKEKSLSFKNKSAAIIGSGPSGLAVAVYLALEGINVKVFEISNSFGGVIKYGVPEFRLPKEVVSKELNSLHDLGIDFEPNSKIAEESIDEISKQFDVVFLGTGVGKSRKLNVLGSELKKVSSAMKFLVNLNQSGLSLVKPGQKVVVIGAGYVGIDAARSALRLGTSVICLSALSKEESLKNVSEKDFFEAKEEGVEFIFDATVLQLVGDEEGFVKKVIYGKDNEEVVLLTDKVIYAIGQIHEKNDLKNSLRDNNGKIIIDNKYQTKIKNVFAGGDCVLGPKTVIEAIATGRDAAKEMIDYLKTIN
jgi:glutamate synthase (NADPH) small chain